MKSARNIVLSFLVTLFLLSVLFTQLDLGDFLVRLSNIQMRWLALGFFFYLSGYLLRALRFNILLEGRIGIKKLFPVVCVHYFVNNILPARTGELSYIYMVRRFEGVSASEGFSTLTIARFFDFISITLLFIASLFLVEETPEIMANALFTITLSAFMLIGVFAYLVYHPQKFIILLDKILEATGLKNYSIISHLRGKIAETLSNLGILKSKRVIFYSLSTSIFIWSSIYLMTYSILQGMEMDMGFFLVVLGATLSFFSNILPLPSLGGFGVYEGAWALAFIALGMEGEAAVSSGLGVHVVFLSYMIVLGVWGIVSTGVFSRRR
ncbi:MAG: hypothetical protein B6U97_03820 [Candidatus Altiarchaeales archaeon ex4484_96]|nr:MAG: hypothetical protein B6U97_03820 [Candidatus Altiarchaeales archaeon ex4484_96]